MTYFLEKIRVLFSETKYAVLFGENFTYLTTLLPGTQTETPVTLYSHLPPPRYTNRDACYPVFSPPPAPSQVHKQRLLFPCILTSPLPGTQTETPVTLYSHLPPPRYTNRDSCYPVFSPPPSQVHKQRLLLPCILTSPLPGTQTETPVTLYSHLPLPGTQTETPVTLYSHLPLPGTQTETPVTLYSHLPPPRYTNRDACYPVFSPPPSQVHKQRRLLPCILTSPLPGTQTETPVSLYSHLPPPRYTNRDACYPVFSPPPSQVHKQRLLLPCILTSPLPGTQTETPVTLYSHLPPPRYTNRDSCYPVFSPPPPRYTNRDTCYPVFSPPPSQVHKQRLLLPCILTPPPPPSQVHKQRRVVDRQFHHEERVPTSGDRAGTGGYETQ